MADLNNSLGKRKTMCSRIIFELEDDVEQLLDSPSSPDNEPLSKVIKKEDATEPSDSNLYQELSQTSVETNISILEKLTELQEENMKLKRQLEEMNNKMCKCSLNLSCSDETDSKDESLITVKFHDKTVAEEYKSRFTKFLQSFFEFTYTEDNLIIHIDKNTNEEVDSITNDRSPLKKRKRRKSKSKSKDLFVLDTTPSTAKTESNLKYTSKYLVTVETENSEKDSTKFVHTSVCFNCEQNHSLRDCPQPKNYFKINAARNKMKQHQLTKTRYHTEEDQKYAHLKAGEISSELQEALGICSKELPPYIYRMRRCGYPPGWMEDARVVYSNISLYDMDGKELSNKNNNSIIDPEKVIEYPGFNIPMEKGVRDDYKHHDCPPYSEKYGKNMMLDYINKMIQKEEDNLETCDMELDQSSDEMTLPPGCEPVTPSVPQDVNRLSPSLTFLELKKMQLLAELDESHTNGNTVNDKAIVITAGSADKEKLNPCMENNANDSINLGDSLIVVDDSEVNQENDEFMCDTAENDDSISGVETRNAIDIIEWATPKTDNVRKTTFGTPLVKGASPYNRLPHPDKFSKDISPVINFENLPNTTGKYEQMNNILQKIRRTLKNGDKS